MKTVEIDGKTYKVWPLPPYLVPFTQRIGKLTEEPVDTEEKMNEISGKIQGLMNKVFDVCCKPRPEPQHSLQVFHAISEHTQEVTKDYFRDQSSPDRAGKRSRKTGPHKT